MNKKGWDMGDLFLAVVVFAVLVGAAYLFTIRENGAESQNLKLTKDLESQVSSLETKLLNTRLDVAKLTGLCEGLINKFDELERKPPSPVTVRLEKIQLDIIRHVKPKTLQPEPHEAPRKVPASNLLERAGIKKKSAMNGKGNNHAEV